MKWELQERSEDGTEFWICGENKKEKGFGKVWTFLADVFIDTIRNRSRVEFDVYSLPRHIVEDSGWKTLQDAASGLKKIAGEAENLGILTKAHNFEIFCDEFSGFRLELRIKTSDKKEIEKEITRTRHLLRV